MRTILTVLLTSVLLGSPNVTKCKKLFTEYHIDPIIKTSKRWGIVCKNKKLQLYTDIILDTDITKELCGCLQNDKESRSILESFFFKGD